MMRLSKYATYRSLQEVLSGLGSITISDVPDDCIETAEMVISRVGGEQVSLPPGYNPHTEDNVPRIRYKGMESGEAIDAHTWVLVDGRFSIDVWADEYFDLSIPEQHASAEAIYGPVESWQT